MLKAIILTTLLFVCTGSFSQELLANGGLNKRNVCTEFHAMCAPEAWFFLPKYVAPSRTEDSVYYSEVLCVGNLLRGFHYVNYLYSKILCRLQQGKQYTFSIWVNAEKNAFHHLDIWMGMEEPKVALLSQYISRPAFSISPVNLASDKGNWKKYSYVYTAKGDERFVMIGNMTGEGIDRSEVVASDKSWNIYYVVDEISLQPVEHTPVCPEYNAVVKQLHDQDRRHPSQLVDEIALDSTMMSNPAADIEEPVTAPLRPARDTLVVPDVLFQYKSSKLNAAFIHALDSIAAKLGDTTFTSLEITGHTDNKGSPEYNLKLSLDRATAIKNYLVTNLGINARLIVVHGAGEAVPVAGNETEEGRRRNRRVEVVVKRGVGEK